MSDDVTKQIIYITLILLLNNNNNNNNNNKIEIPALMHTLLIDLIFFKSLRITCYR